MSDTPRTDAAIHTIPELPYEDVDANFARQLERELAASRAEAEHLARDYNAVAQQSRDYQEEVGKLLVHRARLTAELSAKRESTLAAEVERWKAQCKWEREEADRVTEIGIMSDAEVERLAGELEISKNETKHYRQLANHLGDEAAQPHTKLDELTAVLTNLCDWIDQLTILDIRKEDGSERRYDEVKQKAAWAREVLK